MHPQYRGRVNSNRSSVARLAAEIRFRTVHDELVQVGAYKGLCDHTTSLTEPYLIRCARIQITLNENSSKYRAIRMILAASRPREEYLSHAPSKLFHRAIGVFTHTHTHTHTLPVKPYWTRCVSAQNAINNAAAVSMLRNGVRSRRRRFVRRRLTFM